MKQKKKVKVKNPMVDVHPKLSTEDDTSAFYIEQASLDSLQKKSEEHLVEMNVLLAVFKRGMDSWKPNEKKLTKEQIAFGRVNSFLSGGKAAQLDSDLYEEFQTKKAVLEKYYNIVVKSGQLGRKNLMVVSTKNEAEAYATAHKLYKHKKSGHVRTAKVRNKIAKQFAAVQEYASPTKAKGKITKGNLAGAVAANFANALTAPTLPQMKVAHIQREPEAKPAKPVDPRKNTQFGDYTKNQSGGRDPAKKQSQKIAQDKFKKLRGSTPDQDSGAAPRTVKPSFSLKNQRGTEPKQSTAGQEKASKKVGGLHAPTPGETAGTDVRQTNINFGKSDQKGYGNSASKKARDGDAVATRKSGRLHSMSGTLLKAPETKMHPKTASTAATKGAAAPPNSSAPKRQVKTLGQITGKASETKKTVAGKATGSAAPMMKAPAERKPTPSTAFGKDTPSFLSKPSTASSSAPANTGATTKKPTPKKAPAPTSSTAFGNDTPSFLSKGTTKAKSSLANRKKKAET